VLTNAPRDYAVRVLDALGLAVHFDGVIAIEDMAMFGHVRPKPDRRMLRRVAVRLKTSPTRCALVEDTLVHQKSARRFGMHTVWMQRYLEGRYRSRTGAATTVSALAGAPPATRKVGVHACPSPRYVCAKIRSLQELLRLR
jgi:putative hydrolase of the HAD superfamily